MDSNALFAVSIIAALLSGLVLGFIAATLLSRRNQDEREADQQRLIDQLHLQVNSLMQASLQTSNSQFLTLAGQQFEKHAQQQNHGIAYERQHIDSRVDQMQQRVDQMTSLIQQFEREREKKLGALGRELEQLTATSSQLQRALADNRTRGQWGERMAEDLLRLAGLMEGINYHRQRVTRTGSRPDFTFVLPKGLMLNMDAKFPLDNYLNFLAAEAEVDQRHYRSQFLRDVSDRVREILKRDYIDPNDNTVDCVLIFIPNEQIYRFIHEEDDSIIEMSLQKKVILCSPLTLYAVLAIIRQAADNFALEQSSREVLELLNAISDEWRRYEGELSNVVTHINRAGESMGKLVGIRHRKIEKQFDRINDMLRSHNAPTSSGEEQHLRLFDE